MRSNRHAALIALVPLLMLATPSPASQKPCRDAAGKVVKCEKARKPVQRCKDANGKFVRCPADGQDAVKSSPTK